MDWSERARHRAHEKRTKRLRRAYAALTRAETAPPTCWPSLDAARVGAAKAQVERAKKELELWEGEHPDE